MVATQSSMQSLGAAAPSFSLVDVNTDNALPRDPQNNAAKNLPSHRVTLEDFSDQPLLVMFICNHCPFVLHVIAKLTELANYHQTQGFGVIAISSNDAAKYPQDGPEPMRAFAAEHGFNFPYCYDESQSAAKAFGATCTPDFFVYDNQHLLGYRGQMDDSRPNNGIPVTGRDLSSAMQAILTSAQVSTKQKPSIGCNIKWKS